MHAGKRASKHKQPDNDLTTRQADCTSRQASERASKRRVRPRSKMYIKQASKRAEKAGKQASRCRAQTARQIVQARQDAHEWPTSAQAE